MTSLRQAVQDYLSLRRSLGFKLRCAGALLLKFAAFAETRGTEYVTISLALEWATLPPHQKTLSHRMGWRLCDGGHREFVMKTRASHNSQLA